MRELIQRLFKDSYFRRMFCGLSSSCGGGSGGGAVSSVNGETGDVAIDFQSVTDESNVTTNATVIDGIGGLDFGDPNFGFTSGLVTFSIANTSVIQNANTAPSKIIFQPDGSIEIYVATPDSRIMQILQNQVNFATTVSGSDAVNSSDFVTLSQVERLIGG